MNKQEKSQEIERLKMILEAAPPTFVLEYRGLSVNQVSALRKKVRAVSSAYRVVKNRLALRVLRETPLKDLAGHLKGPTAIAYSTKDPAALAKALDAFTKDNQGLQIKAGYVEGRVITARDIKALADLPSREVLVARFMALLNSPMVRLLTVLKGPARGLVQVLDQIAGKKGGPEGAPGGGAPAQP
jgi:large subunit ribosomal protein L10